MPRRIDAYNTSQWGLETAVRKADSLIGLPLDFHTKAPTKASAIMSAPNFVCAQLLNFLEGRQAHPSLQKIEEELGIQDLPPGIAQATAAAVGLVSGTGFVWASLHRSINSARMMISLEGALTAPLQSISSEEYREINRGLAIRGRAWLRAHAAKWQTDILDNSDDLVRARARCGHAARLSVATAAGIAAASGHHLACDYYLHLQFWLAVAAEELTGAATGLDFDDAFGGNLTAIAQTIALGDLTPLQTLTSLIDAGEEIVVLIRQEVAEIKGNRIAAEPPRQDNPATERITVSNRSNLLEEARRVARRLLKSFELLQPIRKLRGHDAILSCLDAYWLSGGRQEAAWIRHAHEVLDVLAAARPSPLAWGSRWTPSATAGLAKAAEAIERAVTHSRAAKALEWIEAVARRQQWTENLGERTSAVCKAVKHILSPFSDLLEVRKDEFGAGARAVCAELAASAEFSEAAQDIDFNSLHNGLLKALDFDFDLADAELERDYALTGKPERGVTGAAAAPPPDPCTHGLILLADYQRRGEKPTVTALAERIGVSRSALNENKEFLPLREMGFKLFSLFSKRESKGDWSGPRGRKEADGTLEAEDSNSEPVEDKAAD